MSFQDGCRCLNKNNTKRENGKVKWIYRALYTGSSGASPRNLNYLPICSLESSRDRRKRGGIVSLMLSVSHLTTMVLAINEAVELWEVVGWTVRVEGDISYLK